MQFNEAWLISWHSTDQLKVPSSGHRAARASTDAIIDLDFDQPEINFNEVTVLYASHRREPQAQLVGRWSPNAVGEVSWIP